MKRIKYITALLAVVLGLAACEKTIEVEPKDALPPEAAINTVLGVNSLLNNLYVNLRSTANYGQSLKILPEIMADNIYPIPGLNSNRLITNSVNAAGAHMNTWQLYTTTVNQANIILKQINVVPATPAEKARITGQALAFRSLAFFDIVKLYSYNPRFIPVINGAPFNYGIPIVLEPTLDKSLVTFPSRGTVDETYTQIEKDLLQAESILDDALGNKYMTRNVVRAILAKVYLTWGKYDKAAIYADKVIATSGSTFVTGPNYTSMFYADNNPESVFDIVIKPGQDAINESLQSYYAQFPADYGKRADQAAFDNNNETKVGYGDFSPTPELLALYETGDVRRGTITTSKKSNTTVTYVRKYTPTQGANFVQNISFMRISELYLIRAEGNFRAGTAVGATPQADLDKIRLRAGLASVPVTEAAILKERRVELAFEGDRWFDLLRLGQNVPKSSALGSVAPINYFTDFRILAPIPNADLTVNPNLVRNNGY